ncbi:hypothetical protein RI367_003491 [Sorochytrium milnesiophthora]
MILWLFFVIVLVAWLLYNRRRASWKRQVFAASPPGIIITGSSDAVTPALGAPVLGTPNLPPLPLYKPASANGDVLLESAAPQPSIPSPAHLVSPTSDTEFEEQPLLPPPGLPPYPSAPARAAEDHPDPAPGLYPTPPPYTFHRDVAVSHVGAA